MNVMSVLIFLQPTLLATRTFFLFDKTDSFIKYSLYK